MITAQEAKRITQDSGYLTESLASIEHQIINAALKGKRTTTVCLWLVSGDIENLKKELVNSGYVIDDQETFDGIHKPGTMLKISWD